MKIGQAVYAKSNTSNAASSEAAADSEPEAEVKEKEDKK